jgi:hypothetical protein
MRSVNIKYLITIEHGDCFSEALTFFFIQPIGRLRLLLLAEVRPALNNKLLPRAIFWQKRDVLEIYLRFWSRCTLC